MPVIGELAQTGSATFQWTIPHFSRLSKKSGTSFLSPKVQISDSAWWWFRLFPRGIAQACGRIHLRLYRCDDGKTQTISCKLGVKRANGEKEAAMTEIGKVVKGYYTKIMYDVLNKALCKGGEECKEGELRTPDTLIVICRLIYEEQAGTEDGTLVLRQKFWGEVLSRMEKNASNKKENEDRPDCATTETKKKENKDKPDCATTETKKKENKCKPDCATTETKKKENIDMPDCAITRPKDITLTSTNQTQGLDAVSDQENEDVYYDCIPSGAKEVTSIAAEGEPVAQKLKADLRRIFSDQRFCDVVLVSSDGQKFPAHKFILGARSSVFSKMFERDVGGTRISEVTMDDIEGAILKKLLNYLYTASIDDVYSRDTFKLFVAADKYGVSSLKEKCTDLFLHEMPPENICDSITMGSSFEMQDSSMASLSKDTSSEIESSVCKKFVDENTSLAVESLESVTLSR